MPLPAGLQTVVVTGRYLHPDGRPCHGSVLIEPEPESLTIAGEDVVVLGAAEAELDASGRLTLELLATDAEGVTPSGWSYRVTERWPDAPSRTYSLSLPAAEQSVSLPAVATSDRARAPAPSGPAAGHRPAPVHAGGHGGSRRGPAAPAPAATAGAPADTGIYDAREHGLAGDGVTNDQPALARLVHMLGDAYATDGRPRIIYCPPGVYSIRDASTMWRSGVSLIGAGPGATRFVLSNPGKPTEPTPLATFTTAQHGASRENHVADCTFASFEIDGSGVFLPEYDVLAKGLGLQYVLRGHFRDLYIHDTAATGFGCDFLQDTVVESLLVVNCGRLDTGEQMGGAGIGVGIGGWGLTERTTILGCTAVGNGTNGIFLELQRDTWPPPRGIRILGCHAEGNRFGISDWGAEGLIVSGCTMTANLVAGYDVSAQGTSHIAGRGGLVTGCVIDGNVRDGVILGNTPGPYTLRGNRISNNGSFGYREHNLASGAQEPAREVVLESNDIWGNALDGIHLDGALLDAVLVENRVRNNGRRAAPAASGGGEGVRYSATSMVDTSAAWLPDGHKGKTLTVGDRTAVVTGNTATSLTLAPVRPGARTAWGGPTPPEGASYNLPDAPGIRAGLTVDADTQRPTLRDNRVWDNQERKTQTHGLWITARGTCVSGRVVDNDLEGNAVAAIQLDTRPSGGRWERNEGVGPPP